MKTASLPEEILTDPMTLTVIGLFCKEQRYFPGTLAFGPQNGTIKEKNGNDKKEQPWQNTNGIRDTVSG